MLGVEHDFKKVVQAKYCTLVVPILPLSSCAATNLRHEQRGDPIVWSVGGCTEGRCASSG